MPILVQPTVDVRESFLAALDEFRADGRLGADDRTGLAQETHEPPRDVDDAAFAEYCAMLQERALEEGRRPEGWVPDTPLVRRRPRVAGTTRHPPPTDSDASGRRWPHRLRRAAVARLRGHATAMLRDALPIAASLGIDPALVTCRADNLGSRKVIEVERRPIGGSARGNSALLGADEPDQ